MRLLLIFLISAIANSLVFAQNNNFITGTLTEEQTGRPLNGASISIYKNGKASGTISNKDGKFSFSNQAIDSVKFSMIGYSNVVFKSTSLKDQKQLLVKMKPVLVNMDEVVIRPMTALEIVETAIKKSLDMLPANDFENKIFYREIIKDRENYFSVAEAIFKTQYFSSDQSFKLGMQKGRSKEEVSYTRLFEDYHPGGGPEALADKYLSASAPDFFNLKKTKWFSYKKEPVTEFDGKKIFVISFDQKADVHEALVRAGYLLMRRIFHCLNMKRQTVRQECRM